jgi:peptide/nickel transport system substrate-binding protein
MKTSIVRLLASAAAASLLFSACTKVGTESAGGAGGNPWTHHGVLRMANLSEPDTLNPVVGNQQVDSDLAQLWGGYFFNWSDQNEYVPELATEVPTLANKGVSKDGKTIVYHLRRGVLWHDGQPFTADDVIFTFHAIMNKNNFVASTVGYELVTRIEKLDPYTIRVHLRNAYAPFIASFFNQSGTPYPVLPAHLLAKYPNINRVDFNSQPIGTGPFKLERWRRGSQITFVANPKYWRGPPKLQRIEYNPVPNENTIIAQLQSHDIDLEYNATTTNYPSYQKIPGTTVIRTPFTQYGQLGLNLAGESGALADVRVRKALWYALNTAELITKITHDVNAPGYTDQPEFLWAYNPSATHYPYDPVKAKALLDEAGWLPGADGIRVKEGKRLQLTFATTSGSATGTAVAVLAQRQWHDVGIDLGVKTYISSLFFATYGANGILQTGKFDVGFFSWLNGTDPDDSTLWMCNQFPPHGQNIYHFCDKSVDDAERLAVSSNDQTVRKAAYDKIQAILSDQVPTIITWYNRRVAVANTDLKNYRPAHAVSSFWNPYEWEI